MVHKNLLVNKESWCVQKVEAWPENGSCDQGRGLVMLETFERARTKAEQVMPSGGIINCGGAVYGGIRWKGERGSPAPQCQAAAC